MASKAAQVYLFAIAVLVAGCAGGAINGSQGVGSMASSGSTSAGISAGASSATGGATSSSSGSSSASSGGIVTTSGTTTGGASSSSSSSTGTGTSGTGTGGRPINFVDGGYVHCSVKYTSDAGTTDDEYLCTPGTYFCQGPSTGCAQCLSDADCANAMLPTFSPSRPRCDLDSGVPGYQNFCQRCLDDSDCAGNGVDDHCELNPSSIAPSIFNEGFETCGIVVPGCSPGTQPAIGGCIRSPCTTDSDCAGAVSGPALSPTFGYIGQQAEPYCLSGQCYNSPTDPELCPDCYCVIDSYCPDPQGLCDLQNDHCACTDSSQCGGPWPICEFPQNADVDDAGEPLGSCGCQIDDDCGDAGLRCLTLPPDDSLYGGPACLFACDDQRFPGCADLGATRPVCDTQSGLCEPCETDEDCRTATGAFVGPHCRNDGICGCLADDDCSNHEVCGGTFVGGLAQCIAPPLRCTPGNCPALSYCNMGTGACEPTTGTRVCATNGDCAYIGLAFGALCEPDAGTCVGCLDSADCVTEGYAATGYTQCTAGYCSTVCVDDQGCLGNSSGPHCVSSPAGAASNHCGCAGDTDCAGNLDGARCDTDAGSCVCSVSSDCPAGESCQLTYPDNLLACSSFCEGDGECPGGFFCSWLSECLPRCDDGGAGCQAPFLQCDTDNRAGGNGVGVFDSSDPGAVWCYQCVTGDDCPLGQACSGSACGSSCYTESSCHTGELCGLDQRCHTSCDAGACPSGEVCDSEDQTGLGFNICYECLSAADCPGEEGCNPGTHSCGGCQQPSNCPPDAICSNYWPSSHANIGVCLQNCDVFDCPRPGDICAVLPDLTPDHKYCFGCLTDSDCGDAGARCDNSIGLTFTCQPAGS